MEILSHLGMSRHNNTLTYAGNQLFSNRRRYNVAETTKLKTALKTLKPLWSEIAQRQRDKICNPVAVN